ncbi:MAG TPA: glycogen synthase [Candidatus Angelobacter sp.]|nr:glycogen synthase [Candidatus Angelobacter sp.]
MRVGILTKEWPPDVYGGAGVHVEELVRELRPLADVRVHCFGPTRTGAHGHPVPAGYERVNAVLQTIAVDLDMVRALDNVDVVHSHTWYTNLSGHLSAELLGVPHVLTAHSLEPRRPWKAEQLGGGYRISSWLESSAYREAAAIIAVSDGMKADVLDAYPFIDEAKVHVVRNGIDTVKWQPQESTDLIEQYGVDPDRPYVVFVGRITRQKGIAHLLRSATRFDPGLQLVFCASAPDTPEIAAETRAQIAELREHRSVVWIEEHAPRNVVQQLLSHALAFLCPSVYEPLGIVNLEAMACHTAVVSSGVGGIPEVVADGETGIVVHYTPDDADDFERRFADAVNSLAADPARARAMGDAGRARAVDHFGWQVVAARTVDVYLAAGAVPGAVAP